MQFEKFNGAMTGEMETPYGKATMEVTREASMLNVWVRNEKGSLVMKTQYLRNGSADAWHREVKGVRSATWGYTVEKKARRNMLVVLDALVTAWTKNHESDMTASKVASMRATAWRMAQTANEYADWARKSAERANDVEAGVAA